MTDGDSIKVVDHQTKTLANFAMRHRPSYAKDADRVLYNWSGLQYISDKSKVTHPRTEEEVASILKRTRKVRVIGTALSYEAISSLSAPTSSPSGSPSRNLHDSAAEGDVAVISLQEDFIGLKSLDLHKNTAIFHAATSIDNVIHILAKHGHMMTACPGVIGVQTLAGSISTGTHGQSLYQSDYPNMVQSFRIILANGVIRCMTPADPLFDLYLISIGTFGIITEIEIAIRPRLLYTCTKFSCPYDQFLKNYISWNQEAEFAKVWWFPETSMCQVWLVNPANEEEIAYYNKHQRKKQSSHTQNHHHSLPPTDEFDPVEYPLNEEHTQMNQTIRNYMAAMAKDTQVSQHSGEPQFRTLTRFMNMQTVVGWSEQLVTKGIPVPQINCEISVPLEKFHAATEALHRWNRDNPGKLHYPFIYRVTGRSKALMSASHRGPVVWIGFLVYISQAGTIRNDGMSTMYQLQKVLAPFDGLPHWGKHFRPELFEMAKLYTPPVWHRFRQEMRSVDPSGKLTSPFLQNLFFGPAPSTSIIRSKL